MRAPKQMALPGQPRTSPAYLPALENCLKLAYQDLWNAACAGKTGTLTMDDGANWRVTLTFTDGKLTAVTTGASTAATASWSE